MSKRKVGQAYSVPTKCFTCRCTGNWSLAVDRRAWLCSNCGRVYPLAWYKVKEENMKQRKQRLYLQRGLVVEAEPHRLALPAMEVQTRAVSAGGVALAGCVATR